MSEQNGIIAKEGKRAKLENPARVVELNPLGTLEKIGFHTGDTLVDIGAGSGLFSLAAVQIGAGMVYAAETDDAILTDLKQRAAGMNNLKTLYVNGCSYPVADHSADWIMLAAVLHEIDDRTSLFAEMRRILKNNGMICLIEFIKARTPMGPAPEHRLGAQEAEELFREQGFAKKAEFNLGDNLYCQTYFLQENG